MAIRRNPNGTANQWRQVLSTGNDGEGVGSKKVFAEPRSV